MKSIALLSLLLFILPVWMVDLKKDKLVVYASLPYGCDFDGDKLGDLAVWNAKNNTLYFHFSSTDKFLEKKFFEGEIQYEPVFADYDGDSKTDFVFFQPDTGQWIFNLSTNPDTIVKAFLGNVGDLPIPIDINGKKRYSPAIWRPGAGIWLLPMIEKYNDSKPRIHYQGNNADIPITTDFDGDGKSDLLIWRQEAGYWYIDKSSTEYDPNRGAIINQGAEWDIPVPNDYNGDGKSDLTVFKPQDQTWHFIFNQNTEEKTIKFGEKGDIPTSCDLNGDGVPELITWNIEKHIWKILNLKTQETQTFTWKVPNECLPAISVLQKFE